MTLADSILANNASCYVVADADAILRVPNVEDSAKDLQGLASYHKAETTFTFHFSFLTLSNAFFSINNREVKSESGFSIAMASQPLCHQHHNVFLREEKVTP